MCDFIKDESGIWWLINIKAFKLVENVSEINIRPIAFYRENPEDVMRQIINLQDKTTN